MKYGIIADVHSNIVALQTVLQKFTELKVDKIICCGDIIGIGPRSEETVQELIKIKDKFISVRGNHEGYLLVGLPKQVHDDKRSLSEDEINNHLWNHSRLSKSSKDFLSSMTNEYNITDCNKKIYITHYPAKENGEYQRNIKHPTVDECKELFKKYDADIYLYGHTHSKSFIKDENKLYINIGSLGCPSNENVANCGILTITNNTADYEDFKFEYDVDKVIKDIELLKYPMYEGILDIFFGGRR